MKKLILFTCFVFLSFIGFSQKVKETMKISVDQVPASVLEVFNKEYSALPQDGYWTAFIEKVSQGRKVVAKPIWYAYNKRSKSEKIEVRFNPDGQLSYTKGLNDKKDSPASRSGSAEKKKTG